MKPPVTIPPAEPPPDRLVRALGEVGVHQHLCLIYETREEQFAAVVPFLRFGLERGERCWYIADDNPVEAVLEVLRAGGLEVERHLRSGALVLAGKRDTRLKGARFDPERMLELLEQQVGAAKAAGYTALRLADEMTWVLGSAPETARLTEYEAKLSRFLSGHDMLAVCQYNRARFAPAVIRAVLETHPLVICGGWMGRNRFHLPPEVQFSKEPAEREVARVLEAIQAEARRDEESREQREALEEANRRLQQELERRQALENALQQRTADLETANKSFRQSRRAALNLMEDAVAAQNRAESALERLRESERRLATLLANLPGMAYRCRDDAGWTMEFVSEGARELTGYSAADLIGNRLVSFETLIHPEDRSGVRSTIRAALKAGEPFRILYRIRTGSGEERWVWDRGQGVADGDQGEAAIEGFIADVTERKRAEEALARERTLLRTLLDHLPVGVYAKDSEGRKTLVNRTEMSNMGVTREAEALGKTDLEVYPEQQALAFMEDDRRVMETREVLLGREEWVSRPGGQTVCVITSKAPLYDGAGRITGLVGISQDITERKRAEEALQASEAFQKAIITSSPLPIISLDVNGIVRLWNHAAETSFGWTEAEVFGHPLPIVPEELREEFEKLRQRLLSEGAFTGVEAVRQRKDGSRFDARLSAAPIRDATGRTMGIVAFIEDVSRMKRDELALRTSLAEKTALLKEVHHRVKNNLQIVSSLLSLQAARVTSPEVLSQIGETRDRVRSMALLHETLYRSDDLARVSLGSYAETLCAQLVRSFGPLLQARVRVEVESDPVVVTLDQAVPCGLLLNELVTNALKHAFPEPRTGTVRVQIRLLDRPVRSRRAGGVFARPRLDLSVEDDGVGLPAGFAADQSDTLGLEIVATLVEQLHGELSGEPNPGGGTRFRLRFALAPS